jgi:hypothetical protein
MQDGIVARLYTKALSNQVSVAVGTSCSKSDYSIPALAQAIIDSFSVDFQVENQLEFFQRWNELVALAEKRVSRPDLVAFIRGKVQNAEPTVLHKKIAALPISNFIDTTFDRTLHKALIEAGRKPILHDWREQAMGNWKQSNPENPNIFFMLPNVLEHSFFGIYEPATWWKQNRIQVLNMAEMLAEKDLILLDYSAAEAECILHLNALFTSCEKVINYITQEIDAEYWLRRGVYLNNDSPEELIESLLPHGGSQYSPRDMLIPRRRLIEVSRSKEYDCFISYFSGDGDFVHVLERDLRLRGVHVWRDNSEIDIGDSITDRIQEGLSESYSFVIVLSPAALSRAWVKEELRAAYRLRADGEFKILPIMHKECDIPPFLGDYKYADFRDKRRYHEQMALLERAIKNAVKRAREKK